MEETRGCGNGAVVYDTDGVSNAANRFIEVDT